MIYTQVIDMIPWANFSVWDVRDVRQKFSVSTNLAEITVTALTQVEFVFKSIYKQEYYRLLFNF